MPSPAVETSTSDYLDREDMSAPKICRTELTFDFHRLNVLLLRGVAKESATYGRKIARATMSEARIRATVGKYLIFNN